MVSEADILEKRHEYQDYWREPHDRFDDLVEAYHGNFQKLWPGEFRRGEAPKIANWVKLGWDRYSTMVGKLPTNHVRPHGKRRRNQRDADRVEQVLSYYDESSNLQVLIKWYAFYLVGLGAGCIGVLPDGGLNGPRYFVKDPRTVLPAPGAGSMSATSAQYGVSTSAIMSALSLSDVIFNEMVTASFLLDHFRDLADSVKPMLNGHQLSSPQEMITYLDRDMWQVLVNGKRLLSVEHELDFVPVRFTTMFAPDQLGGQSAFEQNIGLVLAYTRLLNQKLTYNGNIVWPWLVKRGVGDVNANTRIIELLDANADAKFLSPPAQLQSERDLETLDRLIRVMNHDTESMQGEAPGSIVTGRSVIELNRDVRTQVTNYWEVMKPDIEFIKSAALIIDEKHYGGVEKSIYGRVKGEPFEATYVPRETIGGNHAVEVDFGIGVGGFDGFVELMQFAAQGFADEQTVMEYAPWVRSVSETRRKVLLDRMEKLLMEMVAGSADINLVNHISTWHDAVDSGQDPWRWIQRNPFPQPQPMAVPGMEAAGGMPPGEGGAPAPTPGAQGLPPTAEPTPNPRQLLEMMAAGGMRGR
jgi:hypothetical protein